MVNHLKGKLSSNTVSPYITPHGNQFIQSLRPASVITRVAASDSPHGNQFIQSLRPASVIARVAVVLKSERNVAAVPPGVAGHVQLCNLHGAKPPSKGARFLL